MVWNRELSCSNAKHTTQKAVPFRRNRAATSSSSGELYGPQGSVQRSLGILRSSRRDKPISHRLSPLPRYIWASVSLVTLSKQPCKQFVAATVQEPSLDKMTRQATPIVSSESAIIDSEVTVLWSTTRYPSEAHPTAYEVSSLTFLPRDPTTFE